MPELPEVEVIRRGLEKILPGQTLLGVKLADARLRKPVPKNLHTLIKGRQVLHLTRRGKYLLIHFDAGTLLIHLGMTGTLSWLTRGTPPIPHDHVDFLFAEHVLRYNDPRRFGLVLWTAEDPADHPLLSDLGLEPLTRAFNAKSFYAMSRGSSPIKTMIMNGRHLVGVGNIYASESLFRAGIPPDVPAGRLTLSHCALLVKAIKKTLNHAIRSGGSHIKNFKDVAGKPGFFKNQHMVYGRAGLPCRRCGTIIQSNAHSGRSTFWCPSCQSGENF